VTLIGALLDFWPLCVASIFMSAGLWIYQILRTGEIKEPRKHPLFAGLLD